MLKVEPHEAYPPEEGCFLRGNDNSPAAVAVLLNGPYGTEPQAVERLPGDVEQLVRASIETGAALAGTLQTENIGIEKIVCNVVANPNIRYLVLCGVDVEGHCSGDALRCLVENGIDEKRTIIDSKAATPYLFNISEAAIARFREQLTVVNLIGETDVNALKEAVSACYQEKETPFRDRVLRDPGAFPDQPILCTLTWRVEHPEEIESWEIDEAFLKKIEAPQDTQQLIMEGEEPMDKQSKGLGLSRRLLRITQELAEIAQECIEDIQVRRGAQAQPAAKLGEPVPKEAELEMSQVELPLSAEQHNITNQLRAYPPVLAALETLNSDVCHDCRCLAPAIIATEKGLKNINEGLGSVQAPEVREALESKVNGFLARLAALPHEKDKSCQKMEGRCKLEKVCLVSSVKAWPDLVGAVG